MPARHGPRGEHAVVLEPQIPVQAPRVVLLDHEARQVAGGAAAGGRLAGRLGGGRGSRFSR